MKRSSKFFLRLSLLIALFTLTGLVGLKGVTHAVLGPTGPPPGDFNPTGFFVVSKTTAVSITKSYVRVYYPANATGAKSITINHGDLCSAGSPAYDGDIGKAGPSGTINTRFYTYRMQNATNSTIYPTPLPGGIVDGKVSFAATCPDLTYSVDVTSLPVDQNTNMKIVEILADEIGPGGQNVFRVTSKGALIGQDSAQPFGIELYGWLVKHSSIYNILFGSDCTIPGNSPKWEPISIKDPDNGTLNVQNPPKFTFRVYDQTAGAFLNPIGSASPEYKSPINMTGTGGANAAAFTPNSGSNTTSTVQIWMKPNHKYAWELYNVFDNNTLQFILPTDSIYNVVSCQKPWIPAAVVTGTDATSGTNIANGGTVTPGQKLNFFYHIDNAYSATAWDLPVAVPWHGEAKPWNGTTYSAVSGIAGSLPAGTAPGYPTTYELEEANWQVPATATNGSTVCRLLRWGPPVSSTAATGTGTSPTLCYKVVVAGSVSCTDPATAPIFIQPNTPFSLTQVVNFTGAPPASPTMTISITNPSGGVTSYPATIVVGSTTITGTITGITEATAGAYTVSAQLYSAGVATGNACAGGFNVVDMPYFQAYGAGISAGGEYADIDPSCSGGGTLAGWFDNTKANGATVKYGAGSQLSALALIKITGFASSQTVTPDTPTNLTFANDVPGDISTDDNSPSLGGNFGGYQCLSDATQSATPIELAVPATGVPGSGQYHSATSLTLTGGTLGAGTNVSIFVDGDVYITGNVTYDDYSTFGWTPANTPSLYVKATGNIYINNSVTSLDGIYEAKKSSSGATDGQIFTCGQLGGALAVPVPAASMYSSCNNQLTVHGMFIADQVNLMRTYGSIVNEKTGQTNAGCLNAGTATTNRQTCAGEVFDFSPANYLSNPAVSSPQNSATQYDTIQSLPPVL